MFIKIKMIIEPYKNVHTAFNDEKDAIQYLIKNNYIDEDKICRLLNLNLSINYILYILYHFLGKVPVEGVSGSLSIDNSITISYYNLFRKIMFLNLKNIKIGGTNKIVEINIFNFLNENKNILVIGGIERDNKNTFFILLNEKNKENIETIIKENVEKNSIIYTDKSNEYNNIKNMGYQHETIQNKNIHKNIHINTIKGSWNAIKQYMKDQNIKSSEINMYLYEYSWRKKYNKNNIWDIFLKQIMNYLS